MRACLHCQGRVQVVESYRDGGTYRRLLCGSTGCRRESLEFEPAVLAHPGERQVGPRPFRINDAESAVENDAVSSLRCVFDADGGGAGGIGE